MYIKDHMDKKLAKDFKLAKKLAFGKKLFLSRFNPRDGLLHAVYNLNTKAG